MLAALPAHQVIGNDASPYSPSPRLSTKRTHRYHSTSSVTPPADVSFHRRSTNNRRPVRSSPLAGPVLQLGGPIVEVDEDKNDSRPPRVSSTPDLSLISPILPARVARPKTADGRYYGRYLSPSLQMSNAAQPSLKSEDAGVKEMETSQHETSTSRRRSLLSLSSTADSIGSKKSFAQSSVVRPESFHGCPGTGLYDFNQSDRHVPKCYSPNAKDNSWFTANPYETTPKFTRLSLASSNVVLPVSAKGGKRLNRKDSKTNVPPASTTRSLRSRNPSTSSINSQQKKSGSPTSSSMSDLSVTLPCTGNTSSFTSTATSTMTTLAETDGINQRKGTRPSIIATFSGKGGSVARIKGFGFRTTKSAINVREQSPTSSSSAPSDKKSGPPPNEITDDVKVEIYVSRPDPPCSLPIADKVHPSPPARRCIKNFWSLFKNWRHHFSRS